ncbi:hypothetical protein [Micromonospora thermarum]|uniref:Uncharacterized protein n=1 Tax=Micromonospora thermarum TaxID=2720024 RepID=A0ABX0Z256_9ACTN|nr:hypothetical protein [Micromonospora thermarum]NJP31887.1 hypothetical protein [Micromonospora thermarum]
MAAGRDFEDHQPDRRDKLRGAARIVRLHVPRPRRLPHLTDSRATDGPAGTAGTSRSARESEEIPPLTQQRWWTWAAAEPTATNPVADRLGDHCARNQRADVWFAAGTFGGRVTRRCTLPAGRPIVAPLVNQVTTDEADYDDFLEAADGWR